jgi:hypothetical protein
MYRQLSDVKKAGFVVFKTVGELWRDISPIPKVRGVYMILDPKTASPKFVAKGVGGFFKQRDPNIPLSALSDHWVNDCRVLYIGKAGRQGSSVTLHKRIRQYLDFGKGKPAAHYGGRLIWQLQHHPELVIAWKVTPDSDPRQEERKLIDEFELFYAKLPFANLKR